MHRKNPFKLSKRALLALEESLDNKVRAMKRKVNLKLRRKRRVGKGADLVKLFKEIYSVEAELRYVRTVIRSRGIRDGKR